MLQVVMVADNDLVLIWHQDLSNLHDNMGTLT